MNYQLERARERAGATAGYVPKLNRGCGDRTDARVGTVDIHVSLEPVARPRVRIEHHRDIVAVYSHERLPVNNDDQVGVRLRDAAVAVNVGVVPRFCGPGLANVIVWVPFGVTAFDAADGAPVPAELAAVNVKV